MLTRRGRDGDGTAEESGNLVIAMAVLVILANLSVAVLARSLVSLHQVRKAQDFSAALATADGALADAVFQIDQSGDSPPATISGSGTLGNGAFSYLATRLDASTYDVKAKGVIAGSAHAIRATVARKIRFPYAIFSNQGLTFNGNSTANIYSFDSGDSAAPANKARVGSNRAIVVNSGAGAGNFQDYYTPGGSCIGCPTPVAQQGPYDLDPVALPTGTTRSCPAGGTFSGAVVGGSPFVCNENVTFSGTVTVTSPPVVIYITGNHSLTMADAVVNQGGRGVDLQIYKDGSGALDMGSGAHAAKFTGVLYAPRTDLTVNGGIDLRGSLTVNSLRVNGAPNFTLAYDLGLRNVLDRDWRAGRWREVPSSSLGF